MYVFIVLDFATSPSFYNNSYIYFKTLEMDTINVYFWQRFSSPLKLNMKIKFQNWLLNKIL